MHPLQLLSLPFVALICFVFPGYALRRAILRSPDARPRSLWDDLFAIILASVLWTGFWGLVLLQLGAFSLLAIVAGNLVLTATALLFKRGGEGFWDLKPFRIPSRFWIPLVLVIGASALFLHPHEFIFGGADAGVYVNLGKSIVRHGSWVMDEPLVASLPNELYAAMFRRQPAGRLVDYLHVPGFYVTNPTAGEIMPQFYPLHPLWLALFNAVGGLRLSLYATPVWGLLATGAVGMLAHTLFGRRCGYAAFALLAVTATQIWFSRYPTAELLTQYLIFAGLWAFARYVESGSLWYAILAGTALGQSTLVRLDVYFLVALPLAFAAYRWVTGKLRRTDLLFAGLFVAQCVHSLIFALDQSWPYFLSVYGQPIARLLSSPLVPAVGLPLAVVLGIGLWRLSRIREDRRERWLVRLDRGWKIGLKVAAVLTVIAAGYAYFLRPVVEDTSQVWYYWYGESDIPNVEPYNMVRLGWYLTPLGLVVATLGVWLLMNRGLDARTTPLVAVGLFFSVLFITRSRNNPHHIYVMRRYVPVVVPFLVLMMTYAIDRLWRWRRWSRALAVTVFVWLSGWLVAEAWLPIVHVEYAGLIPAVEELAADLGTSPAVVLFNDDLPVSNGTLLGTPLHYLYGHTVFDLQEQSVDPGALADQVAGWRASGQRVILAAGPHAVPGLFADLPCTPIADLRTTYPVLEVSYEHKPREIWTQTIEASFCEVAGDN